MADRSHAQRRTGVMPLLLVAALSALAVVAVYEIGARVGKRPEQRAEASAPADERVEPAPAARRPPAGTREDCADLRQRYLLRCPPDANMPSAGAGAPPQTARPALDGATESHAAQLAAWLNPSKAELKEMAARCEARFDMPAITENQPPQIYDEAAASLSLSTRERAILQRTLADMHAELREFAARAAAEATGRSATALSLEEMLTELQTRPESGFEEAREKLAAERAGLSPPPAPGARQAPGERLLRLWAATGPELERRLADQVGSERAHQLRASPAATWMNRFSQSGCRRPP